MTNDSTNQSEPSVEKTVVVKNLGYGKYRVSARFAYGHISKIGRRWSASTHNSETGAFLRPAGIWVKLSDAIRECEDLALAESEIVAAWVK